MLDFRALVNSITIHFGVYRKHVSSICISVGAYSFDVFPFWG